MLELLSNQLVFSFVLTLVLIAAVNGAVAYAAYFERRIAGWIQNRCGPNRVGFFGFFGNFHFWGLGQPMADGLKLFLKEDMIPAKVDKPLFVLAPTLVFIVATIVIAVIPWGGWVDLDGDGNWDVVAQVANPDIGLLYFLGVASIGVYGVVLGGWASNNKYSLYGGVRGAAQMLSYEVPMGLAILVVVISSGQLRLEGIVMDQMGEGNTWNVFVHPLAFLLLVVTQFAETCRAPFDLTECEQELVGGYHTEYSSMKFAMYYLAEYTHMITNSALLCVLFLGGWHLPWIPGLQPEDTSIWAMIFKMLVLGGKIAFFVFVYMWVRWTLPRFRFDQLMRLCWRGLVPAGMGVAALAALMVYWKLPATQSWWVKVVWGIVGNAAVLVLAAVFVTLTKLKATGRQTNLSEIDLVSPSRPGATAGEGATE